MATTTAPYPTQTVLNDGYLKGLRSGELRVQRCSNCGEYRFPPSRVCAKCLSPEWAWTAISGRGTVWSWIRMHKRYIAGCEPPYVVCLVQLEEGPRMIASVVPELADSLVCDLPVQARFESDGEQTRAVFGPRDRTPA